MDAAPTSPKLYLDEELRPYRSLSRQGMIVILGVFLAFNLVIALFLFVIGAYPAPIFLGLDFIGVLIAFHVSNKRGGVGDRVQVSHDEVRVMRRRGGGLVTLWTSPTAFTRVEVNRDDGLVTQVRLRVRQRAFAVAVALGPAERADFAAKLEAAMRSALAERYA